MKLGDLRKKLRGLEAPACDCPDARTGEHYNECTPEHPWKRRKVWREPGGRPLDHEIAPEWGDAKRVIGLDVGMGGDSTAMVTMSRGDDGSITVEDIKTFAPGVKELPFTGKHRDMHEPDDMSKRRICKAVNAVPGAVLTDHRYCATTVRQLGRSIGDIFLEKARIAGGSHRDWLKLGTSIVMNHRPGGERESRPWPPPYYFVVCPSTSDVPTLVKWEAARGRARDYGTKEPPDEPLHRMFVAVSSRAEQDDDGTLLPVHLSRVSAFALYPAETRVCWTCGGRGKTDVLARVSEAEPAKAVCERCRGFGRLWDHRPHHSGAAELSDERLTRLEDAPPPSRLDR